MQPTLTSPSHRLPLVAHRSPQIDQKDFYRPVVTPFEMHLALNDKVGWTGCYEADFGKVLPGLHLAIDVSLFTGQSSVDIFPPIF